MQGPRFFRFQVASAGVDEIRGVGRCLQLQWPVDGAGQVGYESEAAFNRAFKREFGMPPAGVRAIEKFDAAISPVMRAERRAP